ncbi:MAG TPA: O-antigen ligase family protein [Gemmatimonadales bacterium]|nr:O-antigen ligase family protein [Gemmatimonadales bacterium]
MPATRPADIASRAAPPSARAALRLLQLGAVLVVLAGAPFPYFDLDRHSVPKELALHLAAFAAALVCLASAAMAKRLALTLLDLLLVAFLALSVVGAVGATNPWLAFRAVGVSLAGALVFWTARAVRGAGLARPLLAGLAAAAVLGAATGLVQAYGLHVPGLDDLISQSRAPGGTFGNRNFLAHLMAIAFPAVLWATLRARRGWGALLGVAGAALVACALVLTRSRAAWLGFGATGTLLAVELLLRGRLRSSATWRRRAQAVALALAAGAAAALALPNTLDWRSDNPYVESLTGVANFREGSGRGRLIQWRNTMGMVEDHPLLGVGAGNWPVAYGRYTTPRDPAWDTGSLMPTNPWPSSDWVAYLAERGAPAFVALLLAGGVLVLRGWRAMQRVGQRGGANRRGDGAPPLDDAGLDGLVVIATVVATVVVGAFDAVLLLPLPTFFVWGIVGALAPAGRPVVSFGLGGGSRRALVALTAAAGLAFAVRNASQFAAMTLYTHGRRAATLERAARVDPGSYRIHILLATTYRNRGRCAQARPHAVAARDLFPNNPAPRAVLRACGGGRARRP